MIDQEPEETSTDLATAEEALQDLTILELDDRLEFVAWCNGTCS